MVFTSFLFYLPKLAWKNIEDGRMAQICEDINNKGQSMKLMADDEEKTTKRVQHILRLYMNGDWHFGYAVGLCLCEALNLVIVAIVWIYTDFFLNQQFSSYGADFHQFLKDGTMEPVNPMDSIFPKVTKCTFYTFGYSGTQQKKDVMCVLAQNIINEKAYFFLWFWYLIGGIISSGMIIRRFFMFAFPKCMA